MTEQRHIDRATVELLTEQPVGELALYEQALTHRSFFRGREGAALQSYERLEFLGDALLGFVAAAHLYQALPEKAEGELTRLRARLVRGPALAEYARSINLGTHLVMSENAAQRQGRQNPSILADAYEALVGALYLDQGMEAARAFIERTALEEVDLDRLAGKNENFKSQLLEYVQARGGAQPRYRIVEMEGPSHDRTFTAEVLLKDTSYGQGVGPSKQAAEQKAAAEALHRLQESEEA